MYDISSMHVFDSSAYLYGISSDFWQTQAFSSLDHVHNRSIRAEFENYICILLKGEGTVEFNNIGMTKLGMYL